MRSPIFVPWWRGVKGQKWVFFREGLHLGLHLGLHFLRERGYIWGYIFRKIKVRKYRESAPQTGANGVFCGFGGVKIPLKSGVIHYYIYAREADNVYFMDFLAEKWGKKCVCASYARDVWDGVCVPGEDEGDGGQFRGWRIVEGDGGLLRGMEGW